MPLKPYHVIRTRRSDQNLMVRGFFYFLKGFIFVNALFFFSRSFSSNAGSEAKGLHVIIVRREIVGAKRLWTRWSVGSEDRDLKESNERKEYRLACNFYNAVLWKSWRDLFSLVC